MQLQKEHLRGVMEIEKLSFPSPWSVEMFEREIALMISHFFVVLGDAEVVGYGGYWCIHDEAHIVNLAVHPSLRSRRIGRRILDHLIEDMLKYKVERILLEVRKSNTAAQGLYTAAGFVRTGYRPRYYGSEDAILMEKKIETKI